MQRPMQRSTNGGEWENDIESTILIPGSLGRLGEDVFLEALEKGLKWDWCFDVGIVSCHNLTK